MFAFTSPNLLKLTKKKIFTVTVRMIEVIVTKIPMLLTVAALPIAGLVDVIHRSFPQCGSNLTD